MGGGEANFLPGDEVLANGRSAGHWHRAIIRYTTGKPELKFVIEYKTLRRMDDANQPVLEYVGAADLRPPRKRKESHQCHHSSVFQLGEKVEARFRGSQRRGAVVEVLGESMYMVLLDGEKEAIEFDSLDLRALSNQNCGSSALSYDKQENASSIERNAKRIKLKVKPIKKPHDTIFGTGAMVEVRSDQAGYEGAWYTANIVGCMGDGKFLVQYETLVTEDHKDFLQDVAEEMNIRPRPPERVFHKYEESQRVDVRYNEGWWEGIVSQVLDESSCYVYFPTTQEEIMFMFYDLRPRQDWVNGQWYNSASSKVKKSSTATKRMLKFKLIKKSRVETVVGPGTKVEVRSDQEGYEGAWYTATIIGRAGDDKFVVEYDTIFTDDHRHLLQEVAEEVNIRPRPPERVVHKFEVSEPVDVWYNEGWWEGVISKVMDDSSYYGVYFASTDEEMMFKFSDLRSRQEWVNGQWIVSTADSNVQFV